MSTTAHSQTNSNMRPFPVHGEPHEKSLDSVPLTSTTEFYAALSRANRLQAELDASTKREEALRLQVADLEQQLSSRDFVAQLNRR